MRISTNVTSQTALRHTDNRLNEVNKSIRQLASGHIHNSAADSPGEVYLADILKNLYTGMNQTYKNNEQSASLFQVAEGGLAEVVGVLTELKQLAVHAAKDAGQAFGVPRSNGCVRMPTAEARWLFENTQKGTKVLIQV